MGLFLVRQCYKFIQFCLCFLVISAMDMGKHRCVVRRIHQGGGVADLARIVQRAVCICERNIRIAEQPQSKRPKAYIAMLMSWPNRVANGRCFTGSYGASP
jgi:hypothetical protein